MKARSLIVEVGGCLAVVAMLSLSSPGVRLARAENDTPALATSAPALVGLSNSSGDNVCRVEESDVAEQTAEQGAAITAQLVERLRREQPTDDGEYVVLNGRGYNYRRDTNMAGALALIEADTKQ